MPVLGQKINSLRKDIESQLSGFTTSNDNTSNDIDLSLPGDYFPEGNILQLLK